MTHLQKVITSVGVLFGGLLFFLWWRRPPKQKPKLKDKPPSELKNHTQSSRSTHIIQNCSNQNASGLEMVESNISESVDSEVVRATTEIEESQLDRKEELIQVNQSTVVLQSVPSASADREKTETPLDQLVEEIMVEEEIQVSESVQNVNSSPFVSGSSNVIVRGSDFDISNIAECLESEERPSMFNEAFVTSCAGNNSIINRSNDDEDKTSNTEDTVPSTFNTSTISKTCDEQDKTRDCPDLSLSTSTMEPLLESTTIDAVKSSVTDSDFSFDSSSAAKEDQMTRMECSMSLSAENYIPNLSDINMKGDNCVNTDEQCQKSDNEAVSKEESHVNTRLDSSTENEHKTTNDKKTPSKSSKTTSKSLCKTSSSKNDKSYNENDSASEDMVSSRDSTPENNHHQTNSSKTDGDNNAVNSDSNSSNCDSASNDSGRGSSLLEGSKGGKKKYEVYQFNFPTACCGRLIGKYGKNINWIKDRTGANISLTNHPYTTEFQLCVIEGTKRQIEDTLRIIGRKFPDVDLNTVQAPNMSPESTSPKPSSNGKPVLVQEIMQLNLPEGVSIDVIVSSIVDAGHVFLQQPTHPTFPSLERLNQYMIACYTQDGIVPQLPRPLEAGVICAAPMLNGWYRAQITNVYEDTDECDIKYVDYGGFSRVQGCILRQIRSDFMTLPFQAIECYMANVTPLQDEELFSAEAGAVLEELTQGMLLQAQVVGRNDDGIPYIHIYQITGDKVTFVNRELVNRGVTRWIEILS